MMKNSILIGCIILLIVGCNQNKKYTVTVKYLDKEDSENINVPNDSIAYSNGCEKFWSKSFAAKQVKESFGSSSFGSPILFTVTDIKGIDVTTRLSQLTISTIENKIKSITDEVEKNAKPILSQSTTNKSNIDCPVKVISAKPYQEEYSNFKSISLTYKNVSKKTIAGIRFRWTGTNAFNEDADVGQGAGFDDTPLKPGRAVTNTWNILSRDLKKVTKAWVTEVAFADGSKWTTEN